MTKPLVFYSSVRIKAPVAKVWATLTTPELMKKLMFRGEAISDWKVGSVLIWRLEGCEKVLQGKIVAIEPRRCLSHTVIDTEALRSGPRKL